MNRRLLVLVPLVLLAVGAWLRIHAHAPSNATQAGPGGMRQALADGSRAHAGAAADPGLTALMPVSAAGAPDLAATAAPTASAPGMASHGAGMPGSAPASASGPRSAPLTAGTALHAAVSASSAAAEATPDTLTPLAAAALAPAGGAGAAAGLQARPTVVQSTQGTATIYNSKIEVGFVFDPADNPEHHLQFNGPQVSQSEFTLHGDGVSDVTIDGQQAVAGQWYPLHQGLTLTAVSAVAVHIRPASPKTDG